MSSKQTWNDRKDIKDMLKNLSKRLNSFVEWNAKLQDLKTVIQDDTARKDELNLLLEHDNKYTSWASIKVKIAQYNDIATYIQNNPIENGE